MLMLDIGDLPPKCCPHVEMLISEIGPKCWNVEAVSPGFRKTLVCTPRAGTKRELLGQNSMQNRLTKHSKPISHGEVAGRSVKMMDFEQILSNT